MRIKHNAPNFTEISIGRVRFYIDTLARYRLETGEPSELFSGLKCGRWIRWFIFEILWWYRYPLKEPTVATSQQKKGKG